MVWFKVYTDTQELWEEGNILLIEGKVRVREDRVQLNCDRVSRYQPEASPSEKEVVPQPVEAPAVVEEPAVAVTPPVEKNRLIINLTQTSDEDSDTACLQKVIDTLKEFPGRDEVKLCVTNGDKVINLRLAGVNTNYCPELHRRLAEVVGEEGVRLENITAST